MAQKALSVAAQCQIPGEHALAVLKLDEQASVAVMVFDPFNSSETIQGTFALAQSHSRHVLEEQRSAHSRPSTCNRKKTGANSASVIAVAGTARRALVLEDHGRHALFIGPSTTNGATILL